MSHTIGFIGLGRMGSNIVLHLVEQGVGVVAFNRTREVTQEVEKQVISKQSPVTSKKTDDGLRMTDDEKKSVRVFTPVYDLKNLVAHVSTPRVIWLMVPNGAPVDEMIAQLVAAGVGTGDTIIDGGNTYYKDTIRRSKELSEKGIQYIDCGTSGGLEGARNGACLMIGGDKSHVEALSWLWNAVAMKNGWTYFGPSGAGHFVKMVHNGVEYGMNQALGEGFEILSRGPYELDFAKVAHSWSRGSVVRGWLVELLAKAFDTDPTLDAYSGKVGGGETGTWTLEASREFGVEATVLTDAVAARKKSETNPTFAGKVVSALRAGYGGHKEPK
jgi:6-phosphogluconate dehydrogenase